MRYFRWHLRAHARPTARLLLTWAIILVATLGADLNAAPVRAAGNEATTTSEPTISNEPTSTAETTAIHATFGIEYAVPNGPRNLAEEAPGRIWYTATDAGGVGFLEVTSDPGDPIVRYRTEFYGFGENSQPYDIIYRDGVVWFTLRGVRALGRIDVETREIKTYTLLSVGAAPTGIDDDPSGGLWIAQSNGRISRFDPVTETFTEFILPDALAQAPRMEDVAYQNTRNIWFTMPDANRVVIYDSVRDRFFPSATGELAPTGISIDPDGRVWVTANGTSRVGRFTPTTVTIWVWYDTPTADSGPAGLLTFEDDSGTLQVWLTESRIGSIGRLQIVNGFEVTNREKLGPNTPAGSTWGIIRTSDGHIWVADSGRNLLYELVAPYIQRVYMASVENGQALQN